MAFHAYDVTIELLHALRPILKRIEAREADLAKQLRRAAASTLQNICEANKRVNRDRANRFRVASGEAAEVKGSLEAAVAFEYIERREIAAAFERADRICAMTYRLAK
ncbi:MAG TPA: four helix bundle protein [Kofleriaceae bacterium]|nr:four helix bundle protein [Kofleriaceae bacterium]